MKSVKGSMLKSFVENIHEFGIFLLDLEGKIIECYGDIEKISEYSEKEIVGLSFGVLYSEQDVQNGHVKVDLEKANNDGFYVSEGSMLKKDKSLIRVKREITSIKDNSGNSVGFGVIVSDITKYYEIIKAQKKEAKRQTKEYDLLRSLIDNLPDYIFIKDTESRFVVSNKAHQHILNVESMDELIGKTDFDFFSNEFASSYFSDEQKLMGSGDAVPEKEELTVDKDGNERWLSTTKVPLFDKNENVVGLAGISRDITDRKKLEVALNKSVSDLERSNKELEQFAYVASHDLQEPLRMVSSFTQLLAQRYKDQLDESAQEFIHFAVDGANRMQRLINDLLAYSRVQTRAKPFSEVDMHKILGEVLISLTHAINENHALVTNDDLPIIWADESQMHQILQNLILNAIKFSKEGPRIHVSYKDDDEFWIFSVKDNGIGIEPQYFERIFQIFQRLHTKEKYPGTGIGLAICKRIIDLHGGEIKVESELEKGTTFYFSIKKRRNN